MSELILSAVHSNLENLINRSRTQPHPHRTHDSSKEPSGSNSQFYHRRYLSDHVPFPRIGSIQEGSYDDNVAILLGNDHEETGLLDQHRATSRRKSYGSHAAADPMGNKSDQKWTFSGPRGNSQSRSSVRTPPRKQRVWSPRQNNTAGTASTDSDDDDAVDVVSPRTIRGRPTDSRSLSRTSSPPVITRPSEDIAGHRKRQSVSARIADDSSGDEGGDVARGLAAGGGGAMFGGRAGLGIIPAAGVSANMDFDPVEELDAGDLEVPVAHDGLEVREWSEALRVSIVNQPGSTLTMTRRRFPS